MAAHPSSKTAPSLTQLPTITIQHDFPDVVNDIKNDLCSAEDVWVSCYRSPSPTGEHLETPKSVHGKIRLIANEDPDGLPRLEPRDGIECHWISQLPLDPLALYIACPALSIPPTRVCFPCTTLSDIHPTGIDCMDVAGGWIATSGKHGTLRIDRYKKADQTLLSSGGHHQPESGHRIGRGHVADLTSCQFFPSGQVILTTSLDMSCRIFSTDPAPSASATAPPVLLNPRTFSAPHTGAVTAAAIIGRGQEILTACRDGTLRLWNVGLGTVVCEGTWTDAGTAVVCAMATGATRVLDRDGDPVAARSGAPFVALALSSGRLEVVRLSELTPVSLAPPGPPYAAPLTALAISPDSDLLAYGTQTGIVSVAMLVWQGDVSGDALSLSQLCVWQRTHTDIHALQFSADARSLLVAGDDGLPYRCRVAAEPAVEEELAGFNCDPVRCIRIVGGTNEEIETFVAAGKDGHVRIYRKGMRG